MEHLEIKNGAFRLIRAGIAVLNIISAVMLFIASLDRHSIILYIAPVLILILGIYLLTNGFGIERCWLTEGSNYLTIKWSNRITPVQIHDARILKISLERTRVVIVRKDEKAFLLTIGNLEKADRTRVYQFFINYAKGHNIVLDRHSGTLL
jgi:hypothetical protein